MDPESPTSVPSLIGQLSPLNELVKPPIGIPASALNLSPAQPAVGVQLWQAWRRLGACHVALLSLCMMPQAPAASDSALLLPLPFPKCTFYMYLYLEMHGGHWGSS